MFSHNYQIISKVSAVNLSHAPHPQQTTLHRGAGEATSAARQAGAVGRPDAAVVDPGGVGAACGGGGGEVVIYDIF